MYSKMSAEKILEHAKELLGGVPDQEELNRLIYFYPTYVWSYRGGLIKDFFGAKDLEEMIDLKIARKELPIPQKKQQRGGHGRWIKSKLNRLVIRLLFLRYRIDEGLSKIEANQRIYQHVWSTDAKDLGQSNVRKATKSARLDQEYGVGKTSVL